MSGRHSSRILSSQTENWLQGNWLIIASAMVLLLGFGLTSPSSNLLPIENASLKLHNWNFSEQGPVSLQGKWKNLPGLISPSEAVEIYSGPAQFSTSEISNSKTTSVPSAELNPSGQFIRSSHILNLQGMQSTINTTLAIYPTCGASRVFLFSEGMNTSDLKPILASGVISASGENFVPAKIQPMLANIGPLAGQNHFLLIQNMKLNSSKNKTCNTLEIGSVSQLSALRDQRLLSQGLLISIIFSIALYAFGMYFQSHTSSSNLWLGLWALMGSIYLWTRAGLWEVGFGEWVQLSQGAHYKIEYLALTLIGPLGIQFYQYSSSKFYLGEVLLKTNFILAGVFCFGILAFDFNFLSQYLALVYIYTTIQLLGILYIISRAVLDRKAHSLLLLISVLPLFATLSIDIIFQPKILQHNPISQYAWVFFMFMHCIIQSKRLSLILNESANKSKSLALEVEKQTEVLEEKNRQLLMVQDELRKTNKELKVLSITDGLTGTYNRLYFDHQFQVEWQRSRREKEPFSLILLDIDHFKVINDKYGHLAGDQCLRKMSEWLMELFKRSNDLVCRYGGEEFAILLPNTPQEQALIAVETLRKQVKNTTIRYLDMEILMTISIGVSGMIPEAHHHPIEMLSATDKALYKVKSTGRNNVSLATIPMNLSEA